MSHPRDEASSEESFRSTSSASSSCSTSSSIDASVDDEVAPRASQLISLSSAKDTHGDAIELTKLRLQREQRLRRLLSQRHLGQTEPIPHNAFFGTRQMLSEEDVVWLYSLSNAACFERLLREVRSRPSALTGHLDGVLSNGNPLFHFTYRMSVGVAETAEASPTPANHLPVSAEMQRWWRDTPPIVRKRHTSTQESADPSLEARADSTAAPAAQKRAKTMASGSSASAGLVAQSMQAWETHLTATLTEEGETVEQFRQRNTKTSYTDKQLFQRRAAWEEYRHELAIQEQQRDREAKRAIRRGEVEDV